MSSILYGEIGKSIKDFIIRPLVSYRINARSEFLLKVKSKNITSTNFLLRVLCWVFFIRSSALALLT
jgi:hypothetical protein